jgi:predicted SAM-dependent methyltransferase
MADTVATSSPLRLHIGGVEPREGWKILNIQAGPNVDFIGDCTSLAQFADDSVDEVYASHVYEHLGHRKELSQAIAEVRRILKPGGLFKISVPDLEVLCKLFLHPELKLENRVYIIRMMFGGQIDAFDYHKVGFNWELMCMVLGQCGFTSARRVKSFDLFKDTSLLDFGGILISLNVEAVK